MAEPVSQIETVINFSSALSLSTSIPCRWALLLSTNTLINGGQHTGHHSQSNIIFISSSPPTQNELSQDCLCEKECFYISACIKRAGCVYEPE